MTDHQEQLRYPIGRFQRQPVSEIDREILNGWIEELEKLPAKLREAVNGLNEAQLNTPYRTGGWNIRQVVHHLADSHLNSYARTRWALTEDMPTIKDYDEAAWAELPDARLMEVEVSLRLLDSLHRRWTALLRQLEESHWERQLRHPLSGPIDLRNHIGMYAWHGRHHIAHITELRRSRGW